MAQSTIQISATSDDGTRYRDFGGTLLWNATITIVGYESVSVREAGVGLLFENVPIQQGHVVNAATLTVTARVNRTNNTVNSKISAHDVDNASFVINTSDYATKFAAKTTAQINWDGISGFTADAEYTSPNIKTVIQEIIDRPGWSVNNNILIFWEDHENRSTNASQTSRDIYDYGQSAAKAAKLNLTYDVAGQVIRIQTS